MKRPTPQNKEAPFAIGELFFSETDHRGVITTGNDVFVRVSGYKEEELVGSPHNVIRHPDMPKAVFKYLWEQLKANQPIVAYVKNLSADGSYYWVLASVTPIGDKYISVRLKPTTETFNIVKDLYAQVLETEKKQGMDASYEFLFAQVKALGFQSYTQFSLEALTQELDSRTKIMQGQDGFVPSPALQRYPLINDHLRVLTDSQKRLEASSASIRSAHHEVKFLPVNMAVASESAGQEGMTLAVVSETFRQWAAEIEKALTGFFEATDLISQKLGSSSFQIAASRFQVELVEFINRDLSHGHNLKTFTDITMSAFTAVRADLTELQQSARGLKQGSEHLKQAVSALYIVCKSGRVEAARLKGSQNSFHAHLGKMNEFLNLVSQNLGLIQQDVHLLTAELEAIEFSIAFLMDELSEHASAA